jgi:hypothetical protein
MSLRVRADVANHAIGLEPLSVRASAWLEHRVVPLGGGWKKTGSFWTMTLAIRDIPEDLLGTSGLVLYFGDRHEDVHGLITLH